MNEIDLYKKLVAEEEEKRRELNLLRQKINNLSENIQKTCEHDWTFERDSGMYPEHSWKCYKCYKEVFGSKKPC